MKWRKEGLLRAAGYTGLAIEIPPQPIWTDADTDPLKEEWLKHNEVVRENGAYSWLGHLNVLNVAATRTTALILEDDVDWDIATREHMPPIAQGIRNLTGYSPAISQVGSAIQDVPFGTSWDLLWLGHCGDKMAEKPPPVILDDPSVPPYFESLWSGMNKDPQHKRIIGWSTKPMCTFAYAITAQAAKRLLERNDHGSTDFDVWLHILCKGFLKCVGVNPELFHHHEKAGAKESLINGENSKETLDRAMTKNIWHSARCNSLTEGEELVTCMGPAPKV